MKAAHEYVSQHTEDFKNQLVEWLKIPSVSTDPAFTADIQRAAEWLANDMRRIGLKNVAVMPTNGHPIVYGEWLEAGPDAPTVLVYGHYDVQPAVMEDGWDHDPFDPIEKDGILYARGATDDKGQVMIEMKAAEAMLATGTCPVNLKYIIEGEEESSSENLPIFIQEHKELLKADICLISDTGIQSEDQPSIVYGLRGLVTMEVQVSGPKRDMHSGNGGIIHNPAQVIAEIVAKLHNEDGTIAIPGFYDDVATVPDEERAELNRGDVTAERWQAWMGDLPEWGEPGYTKIERTGIRPTLEINGISGGYGGDGFKTVLPAKAKAKVSCRLVPNQSAEKIYAQVRDYILQIAPDTVRVEVISHGHGEPALTDLNHPSVQAAIRAYAAYWEKAPIPVRGGGSIPIVTEFQQALGLPVVLLGFGLPDAGAHGPNECFHLDIFRKGIDTVITYMQELVQ